MDTPAFTAPATRRDESVVETLHGHEIADPYRWLEDPDSPETAAWVREQAAVTEGLLAQLGGRDWFTERLTALVRRPVCGLPFSASGRRWFLARGDGTRDQNQFFVGDSAEDVVERGALFLDPNEWSSDGTAAVSWFSDAREGDLVAVGVSRAGSDWTEVQVLDATTGERVEDEPVMTKFSQAAWLPDGRSYLVNDVDTAGRAEGSDTAAVTGARLVHHRLGEGSTLVLDPGEPRVMPHAGVSADGRFVVVSLTRGTERANRVWLFEVATTDGRSEVSPEPLRLVDEETAEWSVVRIDGDDIWAVTTADAPQRRLVRASVAELRATGAVTWHDVWAPTGGTLEYAVAAGEDVVAEVLVDARSTLVRVGRDGTCEPLRVGGEELAVGAVTGLSAAPDRAEFFVMGSDLASPSSAWRGRAGSAELEPLALVDGPELGEVTVLRRVATSADGTSVPYWIASRADLPIGAPRPTMVYGYGGFAISIGTTFSAKFSAWLEAGGQLVIATLRGGGEYGDAWYDAGRREHKQHVFDDVIGVAEHLVRTEVTTPGQLALHGGSNGGLLCGAAMTQRPDLWAAVVPAVGVLDLLRFHLFTFGAAWISDYGDPDDPDDFDVALAYSPLHNVRAGTAYPATMVVTGDHDDRVVPLHSHKFTATLQAAQAGPAPICSRIEIDAGHGAGKPRSKVIAETADELTFMAHFTGLTPAAAPKAA